MWVGIWFVGDWSVSRGLCSDSASRRNLHGRLASILMLSLVSGCGMTSGFLKKAESDPGLVTGSVPQQAELDRSQLSDEITVKNAVTSADLGAIAGQPIAWVNQNTGSRGAVTRIVEAKDQIGLCRQLETSRESFEGIALFSGRACLSQDGEWSMLSFGPL